MENTTSSCHETPPISSKTETCFNFLQSEVDPRLYFLKYYRDGQIRILQELVQDIEEILQSADDPDGDSSN